jgi:membrane-anchored glycerophosphoryl diester phosphodiesterase (GDPDase)
MNAVVMLHAHLEPFRAVNILRAQGSFFSFVCLLFVVVFVIYFQFYLQRHIYEVQTKLFMIYTSRQLLR